jgi:hypothetical protein
MSDTSKMTEANEFGYDAAMNNLLRRVRQTQALPTAHELARLALHGL